MSFVPGPSVFSPAAHQCTTHRSGLYRPAAGLPHRSHCASRGPARRDRRELCVHSGPLRIGSGAWSGRERFAGVGGPVHQLHVPACRFYPCWSELAWLLVFGPVVARRLNSLRFRAFIVFCGVAAAILHLAVYWGSPVAVIGASGGISGLMGAGMRILDDLHVPACRRSRAGDLAADCDVLAGLVSVVNAVTGVLRIGVNDVALVAWVAHLGGYFAGSVRHCACLIRTALSASPRCDCACWQRHMALTYLQQDAIKCWRRGLQTIAG